MTDDWDVLANMLGYEDEQEMFLDLYLEQEMSLSQLAAKLGAGTATIARRLKMCDIDRRPRGGANNIARQKIKLYRMDQRFVLFAPLHKVAQAARAHPTTVYKFRRSVTGGKLDEVRSDRASVRPSPVFELGARPFSAPTGEESIVRKVLPRDESKGGSTNS